MAEIRVRTLPDLVDKYMWYDTHGHPLPHGVEVLVFYREGTIGKGIIHWNELPQLGCICPYDDTDPDCPLPLVGGSYFDE